MKKTLLVLAAAPALALAQSYTSWSTQIGGWPDGVPDTYEVGGKQYIVTCASDRDAPRAPRAGPASGRS